MAPQINADESLPPINSTSVAVDKDNKNSIAAVRWAIDHLLIDSASLILIHVRNKYNRRYLPSFIFFIYFLIANT